MRFAISAGYHSSTMSFESDRKSDALGSLGIGGDFNVPIPPIRTMIGLTGWLVPKASSGDFAKSTLLIFGAYLGYVGEQSDFFIGPAVAQMATQLNGPAAAPDNEINLHVTSGCGFGGWRYYFGKGVTIGIGINAYYCSAKSYNKDINNSSLITTKSIVSDSASSGGGFIYLQLGWNEMRRLI